MTMETRFRVDMSPTSLQVVFSDCVCFSHINSCLLELQTVNIKTCVRHDIAEDKHTDTGHLKASK